MDYSTDFKSQRALLNEQGGGNYRALVQSLVPRYGVVWRDIAFGYLMLALTVCVVPLFQGSYAVVVAIAIGALSIGYWVAYLQLFIHEGAHYNLWADKKVNDLLSDIFISWQVGTSIGAYRATHFPHHFKLGQADDTEPSYFNALSPRFLVEMLIGVHAIRVYFLRRNRLDANCAGASWMPLVRGVLLHLVLLAFMLALGAWSAALAWIVGVGVAFPLFATLRQLLEHRAPDAPVLQDGSREGVTRIFGDGPIARTFGGAGFNRHLLHHWEPTISYTRLKDYERYVMTTSVAAVVRERRTTYWRAFVTIFKADNARAPHAA